MTTPDRIAAARQHLSVQEAFDLLGVKMPDTKQSFREIAESLAMIDLFAPARLRVANQIELDTARAKSDMHADFRKLSEWFNRSFGQRARWAK